MGLSAHVVPPPAVALDSDGPVGAAIAEATWRHLEQITSGAAPGGARPVMILVEPGALDGPRLIERIAAAASIRGQRVWVVVTEAGQVRGVDELVADAAALDSMVLVDSSHTATAGAALAAWTWLRHDAPSTALGTLRDGAGRACRVATLTAQVPAEPPKVASKAPVASPDKAEQALLAGLAHARASGSELIQQSLGQGDVSSVVSGLDSTIAARVGAASADVLSGVSDWGPGDLRALQVAALAMAEGAVTDDAMLASAAVAFSRADAAVNQESARTGLAAMFGRRKRLTALAQARDEAWQRWCASAASHGDLVAQGRYAEQVAQALPEAIGRSEARWQTSIAARAHEALERWLSATVEAVSLLQPPPPLGTGKVTRSWGDAAPEVRRHMLVPAWAAASLSDDYDGPVELHSADGLERPLAVAWLLGLSATSFSPGDHSS